MTNIKIGKNAIENLTIAMYSDSRIIYREYIQNAADSIDSAVKDGLYDDEDPPQIEIDLDIDRRIVRIFDNAYGVKESDIHNKLANVANSDKDRNVNKGFRGIGRLGGLAYCETLKFITTYPGEAIETTMTWDAQELIRMINDPSVVNSAEEVLDKVISYSKNPCAKEAHYFIVELDNIRAENNELLDVQKVKKYLSANVPVDYNSKFYLKSEIKNFVAKKYLTLFEYKVFVNDEDVFKEYDPVLYEKPGSSEIAKPYDEVESLEFKEFRNEKNELLAWMWFGVCDFNKQIPLCNDMRGIRLRKDNIQVGDHYTLISSFKDQRGTYYFIGELHAVHKDLIPNARRDYFIENPTRVEFEKEVKDYFVILQKLYYTANKAKSACNKEIKHIDLEAGYAAKEKSGFFCEEDEDNLKKEITKAKKESEKSKLEFNKLKDNSKSNSLFSKVIESIEEKHKITLNLKSQENATKTKGKPSIKYVTKPVDESVHEPVSEPVSDASKKTSLITDSLIYLNEDERKLIGKVYSVINKVLPNALSSNLINKIQEELNKK